MPVNLIAEEGPARGATFELSQGKTTIGRDASNTIALGGGQKLVSRRHCEIMVEGESCKIRDLNSRNSTIVNGIPITEVSLNSGDEIQIGENVFSVTSEEELDCLKDVELLQDAGGETTIATAKMSAEDARECLSETTEGDSQPSAALRELRALRKAADVIHSAKSEDVLLGKLLDLIFSAIKAEQGVIFLADPETDELSPKAIRRSDGSSEDKISVSRTITSQTLESNSSILIHDASVDPRYGSVGSVAVQSIKSVLSVPLGESDVGKAFGVIHLDTRTSADVFSEDDLRLLTIIAHQASIAIENLRLRGKLEERNKSLQRELKVRHNMVGRSEPMRHVFDRIAKVAATDATVFLQGESGTGKELAANAIHYNSPRRDKSFVIVNCAALPDSLLESEVFGHEKGAFTGALDRKKGRFELADGGTIFLDEIAEMTQSAQSKLLRVLETGEFERLGVSETIRVDVRIIAATNKSIDDAVAQGQFREDLFHRLNVIPLNMPPLRDHKEDIQQLTRFFLDRYADKMGRPTMKVSPKAMEALEAYSWPGNVRELKNCIERAVVLSTDNVLTLDDFDIHRVPEKGRTDEKPVLERSEGEAPQSPESPMHDPTQTDANLSLEEIERRHLISVLNAVEWDKTKAAEILGIGRSTLYNKIKHHGIAEQQGE